MEIEPIFPWESWIRTPMSLLVENRDLLRRFRAGEPRALEEIFRHYGPYLAGLLRRGFSFNAGTKPVRFAGYDGIFDLEDALQETFRRAFSDTARTNYDGLRPYRAYLITITKNVVINAFQARQRTLERFSVGEEAEGVADEHGWSVADDPLAGDVHEPTGNPEHDAQARELRALVKEFKGTLARREAEIFRLRFEEGLSHTEITDRIDLSPSKIKTAEGRIRKQMLRFMRSRGYLEGRRPRADPIARTLAAGGQP